MKKYSKLLFGLILCTVLTISFTACSDDGYSLDKYWESIVTVNKIGDNTYDFTLDNGKKLWVAAPAGLNLKPKYDRAIINYTILSDQMDGYDHYIKLNRLWDVLTKDVVYVAPDDQEGQESIGHDPVKVHSMWQGGDYLNIYFGINTGEKESHLLNLVSADPDLSKDEDIVKLEFRHNANGDPELYPSKGYVSFSLEPYKKEGRNSVTLQVAWTDFSGEIKTYNIDYKYGEESQTDNKRVNESYDTNLNIY